MSEGGASFLSLKQAGLWAASAGLTLAWVLHRSRTTARPQKRSSNSNHKAKEKEAVAAAGASRWVSEEEPSSFEPPFIGTLDQGTSSTRFIVFDARLRAVVSYQLELQHITPKDGWVEVDPKEILEQSRACMRECMTLLEELGFAGSTLKIFGLTNQRETSLVWDRQTGQPLANAIVWLDTRTSHMIDHLLKENEGRWGEDGKNHFRSRCGLPLNPYFSATKLKWLLQQVPAVQEALGQERCLFGTIDSWLIWNFTGGPNAGKHITDVTNASRTMLMNLESLDWDASICEELEIPMSILPTIRSSSEIYGHFCDDYPLRGVPIAGCLGDQQASLLGHLCLSEGEAKSTYGTGCFLLFNTGPKIVQSHSALTTVAYQLGPESPPVYALEGSIAVAGVALRWLRDEMQLISKYEEIDGIAGSVADAGGMFFVPCFTGLLSPHWRTDARGVAVGISQRVNKAHFIRAVLEGISYQTAEILTAMHEDSGVELRKLEVSGGMAHSTVFLEVLADILGIQVERPQNIETTALGAAIAAGMAIGLFDQHNLRERTTLHDNITTYNGSSSSKQRSKRRLGWEKAVRCTFGWADGEDDEEENN
ncbi:glycerol kinase [Balamuthia mandrillaris]